jgi:transposase-like protein
MGRHVWSEGKKAEALALLADPEQSYYDVHKATGVPASTLCYWASAAGIEHSNRLASTEKAREARVERIASKRALIAEKFLDYAETFADQAVELAEGLVEVKEGVFISGGRDANALMQASTAALTAHRLEMGEATSVQEHRGEDAAEKVKARVDELSERRAEKSA